MFYGESGHESLPYPVLCGSRHHRLRGACRRLVISRRTAIRKRPFVFRKVLIILCCRCDDDTFTDRCTKGITETRRLKFDDQVEVEW